MPEYFPPSEAGLSRDVWLDAQERLAGGETGRRCHVSWIVAVVVMTKRNLVVAIRSREVSGEASPPADSAQVTCERLELFAQAEGWTNRVRRSEACLGSTARYPDLLIQLVSSHGFSVRRTARAAMSGHEEQSVASVKLRGDTEVQQTFDSLGEKDVVVPTFAWFSKEYTNDMALKVDVSIGAKFMRYQPSKTTGI